MIYCVEDDKDIRDLVLYTLRSTGFDAEGCSCAGELWGAMKKELPQLILLDIMLPGDDGISILRKLKASPLTENIPVVLASARGEEYDKVTGLDIGADDYLVKPFGMMEMVSRIRAVLRRSNPEKSSTLLQVGDITVDKARHHVEVGGKEISLTLKEYELLTALAENTGAVMTRENLLSMVWQSEASVETRTVDVHIGTLRTKLGKAGERIKTVRGVGYRIEADNEA